MHRHGNGDRYAQDQSIRNDVRSLRRKRHQGRPSVQTGIAVSVDLKRGEVTVPKNVDAAAVRRAIVAAGYDAPLSPASSDAATAEPADAVKTSCCCG
jgi:hypothetical protein